MLGYIYFIINTVNGKKYVGQTQNIDERKYKHFSYLRRGVHHSHKLQRAYNKYGESVFDFEYQIVEVENEKELMLLEQKTIADYNTYYDGYNETQGGEGTPRVFDYYTACILYKILQRYEGVNRQIAKYYNCDHRVIDNLKKNTLYEDEAVNEEEVNKTIKLLELKDENLLNNYKPHNKKKLETEQIFEILSIILKEEGYDRLIADIFGVDTKLLWRLKQNIIYIDDIKSFNALTEEEKKNINLRVKEKYDLEHKRLERKRGNVKSALTQEQVNYILDNKDKQTQVTIAKALNISSNRVSSVIRGKSYKDLVAHYYNTAVDKSQN